MGMLPSAGTVPVPDTGYGILKKLIYVCGHTLRYEYVPGTDTVIRVRTWYRYSLS
jgi:hypothetical protein